nr:YlbF family regulator [Bacillus subtilis]
MAVNFYDVAYDLENALRGSEEFTRLKNLYDEVNADESAKRMFENFRDVQLRLQQKQMAGEEITQEEVTQAQKTVALVQQARKNFSADGSGAAHEHADW